MTEHDRFDAWLFHDDELGYRWAATCGCGASFGTHKTMLEALDAARPHYEDSVVAS